MYCRYCNRRRIIGTGWNPRNTWDESFYYIEKDTDLREIIVSGGDPLTLAGSDFEHVVARLRGIDHVQVIRVSTRVPVVDPDRLKSEHLETLRRYGPVWVVLHINHPQEVSPEFKGAVENLRQAGASIVSQTVLLRGVNDCPHILMRLFEALVALGVKPYYLFQLDEVKGAMHFKVSVSRGIKIVHFLRRNGSGLAVPHYAVDITGGLGKVPLDYQYMKGRNGKLLYLESLSGGKGVYADDGRGSRCLNCGVCDKPFA